MAGGWAKDGAVQDQIYASVNDALALAKSKMPKGESAKYCEQCDEPISQPRRAAIPGVQMCIQCQSDAEKEKTNQAGINRRGSKDSQLR